MTDSARLKGRTILAGNEPVDQNADLLKVCRPNNTRGTVRFGVIGDGMYTPTRASTKGRGRAAARAPLQEILLNETKLPTTEEEDESLRLTPGEPLWPGDNLQRTNPFAGLYLSKRDSIAPPEAIRNTGNNAQPIIGTAPVDNLMRRLPTLGSSFEHSNMAIYHDVMAEVKENLSKHEQDMINLTTGVTKFLIGSPVDARSSSSEFETGTFTGRENSISNINNAAHLAQAKPLQLATNSLIGSRQYNGSLIRENVGLTGSDHPTHQGVSQAWTKETVAGDTYIPWLTQYCDDDCVPCAYDSPPILSNYLLAQNYISQGQPSLPNTGLQGHNRLESFYLTEPALQSLPYLSPSGFHCSPNYKGNWMLAGNQSADISENDSCSVWITNLNLPPGDRAYHELLSAVRGCGKVYACVVNPPDPLKRHTTSAAKLVFFDKSGALELFRRTSVGEFVINGYVPKVVYNRIRTASQQPSPVSRVIHIEGPKQLVNFQALSHFFSLRFTYQNDDVFTLSEDSDPNGLRRLEWRFGSYRCQAATAVTVIEKLRREITLGCSHELGLWRQVNTYYAVDPCAVLPGWNNK